MNDLISVIIPVYNAEKYLRRCVESIQKQSYSFLEIILINDGSTDRSSAICDELALEDKRIVVIHKENGGPSSARNAGLDSAKGEFIAFVDSDDEIEHDMYEQMYKSIYETDSDICICGVRMIYDKFERLRRVPIEQKISTKQLWETCIDDIEKYHHQLFYPWNKLFRSDLLTPLNGKSITKNIRFDNQFKGIEDKWFCLECFVAVTKGITFINICPYIYFIDKSESLGKRVGLDERVRFLEYMQEVVLRALPERSQEIKNLFINQKCVAKMVIIHTAVISKMQPTLRLNWIDIKTILRLSNSKIEKLSAVIMYFLPYPIYRLMFRLYSKGTLKD
ncbi:MAG: glycosyltransferase [Oscillospiraceae bacterium]|jgi:glycosyltransferase involved in cell wall biosynthesis|nr:glycosyltransferase [Oscillospiraceae bacterium]